MQGFSFTPGSVVLVIHAHPDDETFATAAATSAARQAGCSVHLRIFTGGEGRTADLSPAGLVKARQRKAELLEQAAPYVGINDWNYLTRPGRWTDTPHDPSRTIAAARPHDLTTAARAAIDALRPDVILTVGPDGLTGHPDHIACHHATITAAHTATTPPRLVLGAVALADHVTAARDTGRKLYGYNIGSADFVGRPRASTTTITATAPQDTEQRRRAALNIYMPGLGTTPPRHLPAALPNPGDSVLMRLVLDHAGWKSDTYEPVRPQPNNSIHP